MPKNQSTDVPPSDGQSKTTNGLMRDQDDFIAMEIDYLRSVLLTAAYTSEEGVDVFLHEAAERAAKLHGLVSRRRQLRETETPQAA